MLSSRSTRIHHTIWVILPSLSSIRSRAMRAFLFRVSNNPELLIALGIFGAALIVIGIVMAVRRQKHTWLPELLGILAKGFVGVVLFQKPPGRAGDSEALEKLSRVAIIVAA